MNNANDNITLNYVNNTSMYELENTAIQKRVW